MEMHLRTEEIQPFPRQTDFRRTKRISGGKKKKNDGKQTDLRKRSVQKTGKLRDKQIEPSRRESLFRQKQMYGCREADKHTNRFKLVEMLIDAAKSKEGMLGMQ